MTVESFIEELRRIRARFEWQLEPHAGGERELRDWPRYQVRAVTDEAGPAQRTLDPVRAVCFALTGKIFPSSEAAATIGLSEADADQLIRAASDATWGEADGRRRPDTHLQSLRLEIIRAVED